MATDNALVARALGLIAAELTTATWTKWVKARNERGDSVHWSDPKAVRWCIVGHAHRAVVLACGEHREDVYAVVYSLLSLSLPATGMVIENYNDDAATTAEDLRALAERAGKMLSPCPSHPPSETTPTPA